MSLENLKLAGDCQVHGLKAIYQEYFGDKGFFVEIGANDGEHVSNTSGLADIGWNGLYVEPVSEHFEQCHARHINNDVVCVHTAIGREEGELEIILAGGCSTACERTHVTHVTAWNWGSDHRRYETVPVITLDQLFERHYVPHEFELLVVDVEGLEEDVFAGFTWTRIPKMIIVELIDDHPDFPEDLKVSSRRVRQMILDRGYREIYHDCINTIFVI